jgi:hypothetical protein
MIVCIFYFNLLILLLKYDVGSLGSSINPFDVDDSPDVSIISCCNTVIFVLCIYFISFYPILLKIITLTVGKIIMIPFMKKKNLIMKTVCLFCFFYW